MSILSAQSIRSYNETLKILDPFEERTIAKSGMTYGLGPASYDIRAAEGVTIKSGGFALGSSLERFKMPDVLAAYVKDKSSWARKGLCVQNTLIDPGWEGYLTLEYTNHSNGPITIKEGDPIAQIVFQLLDRPTDQPYAGKYQDQQKGPQNAIEEKKPA